MRAVTLKSTGTAWVLAPGAESSFGVHAVLVVRDVPGNVTDAATVHVANQTLINTPARAKALVTVAFDRLGVGRCVNLVIGRPPKAPEDRAQTPVRTLRLSDAHWAELQARGGVQALRDWLS